MLFLALTLFLSITSCDSSSDDLVDAQNVEKLNKQKQILTKLEQLGIDSKNVTFIDNVSTDGRIVVESIDDLAEIFPKELNDEGKIQEMISKESSAQTIKNLSTAKSFDLSEYQRLSSTIPVPNSSMTVYYEFWYNSFYMSYNWNDGVKDVSVATINGNGVYFSYNAVNYSANASYTVNIYGKFYYPIIIDGQNANIERPAKIICFFNPNLEYTTFPWQQYIFFTN